MNLQSIARALNGTVRGKQVAAPGPHHSPEDRSLSVWIDRNAPDGFRVHSFAGDDWRICRDYVSERLGLPDWQPHAVNPILSLSKNPSLPADRQHNDKDRIQRAITLWNEAVSPAGTLVERYLRCRGLCLPEGVLLVDAIRFHPSCPFRLEDGTMARLPAMLGLMCDIQSGEPKAVHRTALNEDGSGKSNVSGLGNAKKMLGPSKDAAIKLTADHEVIDGLGIAEGIETALTIVCADWLPVWACGSAGAIERFPILSGVECLTIFADSDQAGMTAAEKCQERWNSSGQECRILTPQAAGSDWNDIVRAA